MLSAYGEAKEVEEVNFWFVQRAKLASERMLRTSLNQHSRVRTRCCHLKRSLLAPLRQAQSKNPADA
jgi:hypothetical protein